MFFPHGLYLFSQFNSVRRISRLPLTPGTGGRVYATVAQLASEDAL